jgi:hypothetical protein
MKQIGYNLVSALLFSCMSLQAVVIGSDSAVSTQPFFTFPQITIPANRIASFAWMQAGFALQNSATSLMFDSTFPVSGTIQLNGGTMTLNRDFILDNVLQLQGLGTIIGGGHVFSLSPGISSFPSNTASFQNTTIVLNSDVMIKSAIAFSGSCIIEGNGHTLILSNVGSMIINGDLLLHNVVLDGVHGTNVQCANALSSLTLDRVAWIQW